MRFNINPHTVKLPGANLNDDIEIVRKIRLRDKAAFEILYKSRYKKLFILAFQYTKNKESAEEVVQDVFIKIWEKASELNIIQSLDSYLARAVINTSLNVIKKEKAITVRTETYTLDVAESEITEDDEKLEHQINYLEKALELLPPQCKRVMIMSRFDKMKQQDIADHLNISIKTVKNHLTYGFKKLRDSFSDENIFSILVVILIEFL